MKNIAALLLGAGLLSGCSFLYEDASESAAGGDAVIDVTVSEDPWVAGNFEAVNQHGETITGSDLDGEWWIAKTIFTRCPTVCNVMTPNMKELQDAAEEAELDLTIVSFSVDPEFDTPERLESYGESYGADFENWHFVTGYEMEEIQSFVLESFKAQIQEVPEQDDIMHPTRFFLIGPDRRIHRMYAGENSFDAEVTIEDLQQVIN